MGISPNKLGEEDSRIQVSFTRHPAKQPAGKKGVGRFEGYQTEPQNPPK